MTFAQIVILISVLLFGSVVLIACGPKADRSIDVTRQIMEGAKIGSYFGNQAIAARYKQIISALESGLIDLETFEDRRARLDKAESSLAVFDNAIRLLEAAIDARETDLILAIAAIIDSTLDLYDSLKETGIAIPTEIQEFVDFIRFLKGDK